MKYLFSRDTHLEFNYPALFSVLPFYFLSICWACGTAVACGALVPMLYVCFIWVHFQGKATLSFLFAFLLIGSQLLKEITCPSRSTFFSLNILPIRAFLSVKANSKL